MHLPDGRELHVTASCGVATLAAETSVAATGPLIGGVIATGFGFTTLIAVSIAMLVAALAVLLFFVGDPRHSRLETG